MEGGVLAGGEGAQLLVLRDLETSGAKHGVGFVLLLISVQSGELPLTGWFLATPISEIGGTGAGSCSR